MYSVTQRIKSVKQPYGGYLRPSSFEKIQLEDGHILNDSENIHPSLIGLVIDYMTRFIMGAPKEDAFRISLKGAVKVDQENKAEKLLSNVMGTDDNSIICACKLVGYDTCFRAGASSYKPIEDINPDLATVENIRIMINRGVVFFKEYGPVVDEGMTFVGGYTPLVSSGDADFMTEDTLWDFKVSKNSITSAHTLQILMYYIMGTHSTNEKFNNIKRLGFFNPRLNIVFLKNISEIPADTIKEVENEVIGYNKFDEENLEQLMLDEPISEILTITDLMKIMNCSRYTVMKYYTENGLPLTKKGNRYQITSTEFYEWFDYRNQLLKAKRRRNTIGILIPIIIFVIIIIIKIISNIR